MRDALSVYTEYCQGIKRSSGYNYVAYCPIHGEAPGRSTRSFCFHAKTGAWVCYAECGGGYLPQFLYNVGLDSVQVSGKLDLVELEEVRRKLNRFKTPRVILPERVLGMWDNKPRSLIRKGFDPQVLYNHDIGYDKERKRTTYPIRDLQGRLRGVSGRAKHRHQLPRYLVYKNEIRELGFPDYDIEKAEHLWRAHLVYPQILYELNDDPIVVVEGFKVAMWLVMAGVSNVVALMQSSLTPAQQRILELFGRTVIFCLDNDKAGVKNTVKGSYKLRTVRTLAIDYPPEIKQLDELPLEDAKFIVDTPITLKQFRKKEENKKWLKSQRKRARR